MKFIICVLALFINVSAWAKAELTISVGPGTIFTRSNLESSPAYIVIFRQAGTLPTTGYECTLSVVMDEARMQQLSTAWSATGDYWTRTNLNATLEFKAQKITHRTEFIDDMGSECLEYATVYENDNNSGPPCVRYAGHFRTEHSVLKLLDKQHKVKAELSCAKWLSDRKLQVFGEFATIMQEVESYFPLTFEAILN